MSDTGAGLGDRALRTAFGDGTGSTALDAESTDAVWRAVRGECGADELRALLVRAREEPALAEAWRVAQAVSAELHADGVDTPADSGIESAGPVPGDDRRVPEDGRPDPVVRGPARWWQRPRTVGVAAAVAIAAAALVWVGGSAGRRGDRSGQAPPLRAESLAPIAARSASALDRQAPRLAWTELAPGAVYAVTVTTAALDPVARTGGLTQPEWTIPAANLETFETGTVLLWRVEARLADGTRQRSATFEAVLSSSP